jgi:hypothetical protein
MQKLITATGLEFTISWCGPSTIDYALRFEIVNSSMREALDTFTDPTETATLTHVFDEHETVFNGYTTFRGVDMRQNGNIIVALTEG